MFWQITCTWYRNCLLISRGQGAFYMIDLNNIIQNLSAGADLPATIQEKDLADLLPDVHGDQTNLTEGIDPSSFVLLLANILSNIPVEQSANNDETSTDEASTIDDVSDVVTVRDDKDDELLSNSSSPHLIEQNSVIPMEHNVALTWIDSDNFQPPEQDNKSVSNKTELLSEVKNIPVQQNKLSDELLKTGGDVKNTSQNMNLKDTNTSEIELDESSFDDDLFIEQDVSEELNNDLYQKLKKLTIENAVVRPRDKVDEIENKPKADEMLLQNAQNTKAPSQQQGIPIQESRQNTEPPLIKTLDIPVDIRNSQWADKFSEQIVWLGHQGIKSAVIKIHPEDLGPLEISVKVVKDAASVNIISHNGHVRDIVDQALPRLREMMADQGLNLSEVHVGSGENSQGFTQQHNRRQDELLQNTEENIQLSPLTKKPPKGLIDFFA